MWKEIVTTSGRVEKHSWVPLPWCTSQSTTATRSMPRRRASSAHRAALEKRQ